jgi:PAS domain S-box/PAS domain S-box/PAS domain S-box
VAVATPAAGQALQLIVENVDEAIFMFTPDWQKAVYVSLSCENVLGCRAGDLCRDPRSWMEVIAPEDADRMAAFVNGQAKGEVPLENSVEFRAMAPGGEVRWISCRTYPVRDSHGNVTGIAGIAEDVTERKKAEGQLRDSERFLNDIFECFQDGISILDRDLNILRVNHKTEHWYSSRAPLEGKKCYEGFHGRTAPCEICPSKKAIEKKAAHSEIVPFHGEDGRQRGWLEISAYPLVDARGNVAGVIEHARDITERKRSEETLANSEAQFRALFEDASDAIFIADAETGTIIDCNPNAEKLIGRPREEIIGMHQTMLHPPEEAKNTATASSSICGKAACSATRWT